MKLSLISKIDALKNDFSIMELSSKSFGFYINWSCYNFSKEKFSWRLIGKDQSNLLSFDFIGGFICAIEALIIPEPEKINHNYIQNNKTHVDGIPIFGLSPRLEEKFLLYDTGVVNVLSDFFVEKYLNCIRFTWGAGHYSMKINNNIILEFSSDFYFVGISIFD